MHVSHKFAMTRFLFFLLKHIWNIYENTLNWLLLKIPKIQKKIQ